MSLPRRVYSDPCDDGIGVNQLTSRCDRPTIRGRTAASRPDRLPIWGLHTVKIWLRRLHRRKSVAGNKCRPHKEVKMLIPSFAQRRRSGVLLLLLAALSGSLLHSGETRAQSDNALIQAESSRAVRVKYGGYDISGDWLWSESNIIMIPGYVSEFIGIEQEGPTLHLAVLGCRHVGCHANWEHLHWGSDPERRVLHPRRPRSHFSVPADAPSLGRNRPRAQFLHRLRRL